MDRESFSIVLTDVQKLQQTKGIWLSNDEDKFSLDAKHVDIMNSSLRVLSLGKGIRLNGRCKRAFGNLRFLSISFEHMLPIDISKLRQLVFFQGHFIKGDGISNAQFSINAPESLQLLYLDAHASDSPVSLDIYGKLTLLRELQLYKITFENFETSIRLGNFISLQKLYMHDCSMERLPESFGNLTSLQTLDMSNCSMLKRLPESFGCHFSLKTLSISICFMFERSRESLSSLKILRMGNCSTLDRLPDNFCSLSSLQTLDMSHCSMLSRLPESFGNLTSLETLNMSNCSMLERLPESFGNLSSMKYLDMSGCEQMCSLSDNFGQLKCLKFVSISNCKELKRLPDDMFSSNSLATMKAYGCAALEAKSMDSLVQIRSLMFSEIGENPMLIKRWKQIYHDIPLIGAALSFEGGNYPYGEIMSTMFFNVGSKFIHLDWEGQLAEVASTSFPDLGVKVALLLTGCFLSDELKHKLIELASQKFQIIYVDVDDLKGEAEGSSWMEERDERIREMLVQLPEGSRAWTSHFFKSRLLFAYSLWEFTGGVDTSIVVSIVVVDEKGRRKLFQDYLVTIFTRDNCYSRRVDLSSVFSPRSIAWRLMRNQEDHM